MDTLTIKRVKDSGRKQGYVDGIDKYSNELWKVIEKATVNCKFDFSIDDLHNLEIVIKGLAEEMKEKADENYS